MKDICNFLPAKKFSGSIDCYNFVFETNLKKHHQPFVHFYYRLNIVSKGNALFKSKDKTYHVDMGTVFFTFPDEAYTLEASDDFSLCYISFGGAEAENLLESSGVGDGKSVFPDNLQLLNFWMDAIKRFSPTNAHPLTESVLMYTLSFVNEEKQDYMTKENKFEYIMDYISKNYTKSNFSLKNISDIFFYDKKYFSSLFKKKMGVNFTEYLNTLRISNALLLMKESTYSVNELSNMSGFADPFYFSKVFKKATGKSPTTYLKDLKEKK